MGSCKPGQVIESLYRCSLFIRRQSQCCSGVLLEDVLCRETRYVLYYGARLLFVRHAVHFKGLSVSVCLLFMLFNSNIGPRGHCFFCCYCYFFWCSYSYCSFSSVVLSSMFCYMHLHYLITFIKYKLHDMDYHVRFDVSWLFKSHCLHWFRPCFR